MNLAFRQITARPRRTIQFGACLAAASPVLAACSTEQSGPPPTLAGQAPDGTVEMHEVQAAYLGSGTLFFRGRSYPFKVGGVGVGGIGLSTVEARGEVYKLQSVDQFSGTYAQAATALPSAPRAGAISGCRTTTASSCTWSPSGRGSC